MTTQLTQASQQPQGRTVYTIGGVQVDFPTKAYPSQLAMMSKVIQGLKHGQNCLLESPTGSGKSLALLCATLAWQRHEAVRTQEYNDAIDTRELAKEEQKQQRKPNGNCNNDSLMAIETGIKLSSTSVSNGCAGNAQNNSKYQFDMSGGFDDEDDDFKPCRKSMNSISPNQNGQTTEKIIVNNESPRQAMVSTTSNVDNIPEIELSSKKLTVPKVFFGTRTHKQIAQITRELRKTCYKTVRSTILSSREHTCINPVVMKLSNKNEACKELLDSASFASGGCGFHSQAKKLGNFDNLPHFGVNPGFDLEDLVQAGRAIKACPYYASRHLMATADIIFCPYNYLIDPLIRKSMNIEMEGQIIIFDEGHNLEDAAREAASFVLDQDEIHSAIQDAENISKTSVEPFAHEQLAQFLSKIAGWMDQHSLELTNFSYGNSSKTWNGTDLVASMIQIGIDAEAFNRIQAFFKAIITQRDQQIDQAKERGGAHARMEKPTITSSTIYASDQILRMFDYLIRESGHQRDDFRLALIKSIKRRKTQRRGGAVTSKEVLSLNFWCLNPAVEFVEIKNKAHCIILTSGTLSPISSFQTELGTTMPIKLEASHVIDPTQIWGGIIGRGPTQVSLNGSYKNAATYEYQDEVGRLVYRICETMPHGILCFFSSYRALETLVDRWTATKEWDRIKAVKNIYIEPRSGAQDFEDIMKLYYASIEDYKNNQTGLTGAIFLAVFRGKVSEGLDFADNNARAVICIGIPFPNFKDVQVEQKREYNDKNHHRGLLTGSEWYEVQAFRALNQALGRCIRHRHDWGGIILVDERYLQTPRYLLSLSRWFRNSVHVYKVWNDASNSFNHFRDEMKARPVPEPVTFELGVNEQLNRSFSSSTNNSISNSTSYFPVDSKNHPIQFDSDDEEIEVKNSDTKVIKDESKENDEVDKNSTIESKVLQRRDKMKKMFF